MTGHTTGTLRLSIKTRTEQATWDEIDAIWRAVDDRPEIDVAWVYDHFIPAFGDPDDSCLEGWTTLAALAGRTQRVRVGVMVTGVTYRNPAVLAKMASTLDVISGGRLELGLGAGWHEHEHRAYGIEFPPLGDRLDRLDEACAVIDGMLTASPFDFEGAHYQVREAWCSPRAIQTPRPPLVIGGRGERRTLRIAARWADQWNFPGGTVDELAHKIDVLHRHCHEIGRDPEGIEVSAQVPLHDDPRAAADLARQMVAAGAHHIVLNLRPPYRVEVLEDAVTSTLERLA